MPTTRTRRRRQTEHKPVAKRLLDGLPIEVTEENRAELTALRYFGCRDYQPDGELGRRIEELALAELQRWATEL